MKKMEIIEKIKTLFLEHGHQHYGEDVTQQEHAVQCYLLAEEAHAELELRVAAFLHDIGHLVYQQEDGLSKDMKHEEIGSVYYWNGASAKKWQAWYPPMFGRSDIWSAVNPTTSTAFLQRA